jgi:dienelactone hydrolase
MKRIVPVALVSLIALLAAGEEAVTRERMARAYLEFERAYRDHPPEPPRIPEVSRAFDAAGFAFLGGRLDDALKRIEALTLELDPQHRPAERKPRPKLQATRDANEERLAKISAPDLADSVRSCRSRNALLVDEPSPEKSAEFLADPESLAKELQAEIAALEAGNDPYAGRLGDYWVALPVEGIDLPCRLFAPAAEGPMALVVALHGAGGDENMFFDGYGAGLLKEIAAREGFLAVSPATYALAVKASLFPAMVERLSKLYPVDRRRVYVLGHSLGGVAASNLASAPGVRAVCCIAGAGVVSAPGAAPFLVIAGELDTLAPPERLERAVRIARSVGLDAEFRVRKDHGHTLLVPAVLPEAVTWLLAHGGS